MIESISAVTLATHDMRRAVRFYTALGFSLTYGGEDASFASFCAGCSAQRPALDMVGTGNFLRYRR